MKAGIISKNGGAELDPYKYTHELLHISLRNGSKVYENTEVVELIHYKNYIDVITEYGYKIKAKKAIVSTSYNTELVTNRNFATKTTTFNIVFESSKSWQ